MNPADAGDVAGWIRTYTPRLLGVARAFADGAEEAEDLLQEVWITAFRQSHRRPPDDALGAWLYRIALNIGRMRARRARRREQLRRIWQPLDHPGESPPSLSGELQRLALWRMIAELPDLQRQVLLLRIVDGLSTSQAATRLDRAEGTVKASLHRALATLRRRLGDLSTLIPHQEEDG